MRLLLWAVCLCLVVQQFRLPLHLALHEHTLGEPAAEDARLRPHALAGHGHHDHDHDHGHGEEHDSHPIEEHLDSTFPDVLVPRPDAPSLVLATIPAGVGWRHVHEPCAVPRTEGPVAPPAPRLRPSPPPRAPPIAT